MENKSDKFIKYFLLTVFTLGFLLWIAVKFKERAFISDILAPILRTIIALPSIMLVAVAFIFAGFALVVVLYVIQKFFSDFWDSLQKIWRAGK